MAFSSYLTSPPPPPYAIFGLHSVIALDMMEITAVKCEGRDSVSFKDILEHKAINGFFRIKLNSGTSTTQCAPCEY